MNRGDWIRGAILLVAYFVAGRIGLALTFVHASASPIWPPTGIAIALLFLWGLRFGPAVLIGATAFNLLNAPALGVALRDPTHVLSSVTIGFGNTLETMVAVWLLLRFCGRKPLASRANLFRYAGIVLLASAVSATIGSITLAATGFASWPSVPLIWTTWWLGDAGGALLVAPPILLWAQNRSIERPGLWVMILLAVAAVATVAFGGILPAGLGTVAVLAVAAILIWPAIRLGPRGAATAALVIATIAVFGTTMGTGPFAVLGTNTSILFLQVSLMLAAVLALTIATPWQVAGMQSREAHRMPMALAVLTPLVLGVAAAGFVTDNLAANLQEDRFENQRDQIADRIEGAVQANVANLAALRAVQETAQPLGRQEFHEYLDRLQWLESVPGVQAVAYLPAVADAELAAFVADVRADSSAEEMGYPEFVIHPDADVAIHWIVTYIEPVEGNEAAYGLDLAFEPARRVAIENARESRGGVVTAPIQLVQEAGEQTGFLLIMHVQLANGGEALVDSVHRARDLVVEATEALGGEYRLVDVGPAGTPLTDEAIQNATLLAGSGTSSAFIPLDVPGRRWALAVDERPMLSLTERGAPWFLLAAGGAISFMLIGIAYLNSATMDRATAIAAQLTKELRRSNRDLEQFAFAASHDLRQPIEAIDGYLEEAGETQGDARAQNIAAAQRSLERMRALIHGLLEYARLGASVKPEAVDLRTLLESLLDEFPGKSISVHGQARVAGDAGLLTMLLRNLIQNGLKFHQPGDAADVRVELSQTAKRVKAVVIDRGIGIPAEFREQVFVLFRRLHTRDEYEGTGVGLAMVRRIADLHGASVRIRDANPGTRFEVVFPVSQEPK